MADIAIISTKGKKGGKHTLAEPLAKAEVADHILYRAVWTEESNKRQGTSKQKTRSEAQGGGRKPYRQKKTGNARQGTIRAPHYAHGGMAFAGVPRDFTKGLNKKERRLAIIGAFQKRAAGGDVTIADEIKFDAPKTKSALEMLKGCEMDGVKRLLIVVAEHDDAVVRSFRNLSNVTVKTAPNRSGTGEPFSTRDLLVAHKILIAQDAMKQIEEAWVK